MCGEKLGGHCGRKTQLAGANLDHLLASAQARQGDVWPNTARDHQM